MVLQIIKKNSMEKFLKCFRRFILNNKYMQKTHDWINEDWIISANIFDNNFLY